MIEISSARTRRYSIIFGSTACPIVGIETYFTKDLEISTRNVWLPMLEMVDWEKAYRKERKTFFKERVIFFDALLVLVSILIKDWNLLSGVLFFSFTVSFPLFKFLDLLIDARIRGRKAKVNIYGLHAAEHMVINAYNQLKRVPTLGEIKKYSRFSKKCGSNAMFEKIAVYVPYSILLSILPKISWFVLAIATIILLAIMWLLGKKDLLKYLQFIVTKKPSDLELRLAIKALENFLQEEAKISSNQGFNIVGNSFYYTMHGGI